VVGVAPAPAKLAKPALEARTERVKYSVTTGQQLIELHNSRSLLPWEFNRDVDAPRVARMYELQVERIRQGQRPNLFMPVPITVGRMSSGGALLLMDGQHRLAVLQRLAQSGLQPLEAIEIVLCEVVCDNLDDLEDLFVRINSGTPVPAAYYSKKVAVLLDEFTRALAAEFPAAVSAAPRPQRPNFNKSRVCDEMSSQLALRDAIIDGKVTPDHLIAAVHEENAIEMLVPVSARRAVPASVLARASKSGFFLGLREGWPTVVALRASAVHPE
jgi:hypothetical protein